MEILVVDVGNTDNRRVKAAVIRLDSGSVGQKRHLVKFWSGRCESVEAFVDWSWINGRVVLAAYNLPFVQRLLEAAYERRGYTLYAGQGVDIQLEDVSLAEACEREGITLSGSGAMGRAEAAAELLRCQVKQGRQSLEGATPAQVTKGTANGI